MANAWLTPNVDQLQETQQLRTICVAGSLWYLVSGALELLAEDWNWEQFGTATPDEVATYFQIVRDRYIMSQFENVGMIAAFVAVPDRWIELDGSVIDGTVYTELAAVVPASWLSGNDINLPDATGHTLVGQGAGYTLGNVGGEATHTLTVNEMPAHNHEYVPPIANVDLEAPGAPDILAAGIGATTQTSDTGAGQAHNNMPPYLAIRWCIYAGR